MNSADKSFTSHTFISSEISGSNGLCNINTAMISTARIPYFTAYNNENKSAVTLEQLFVPIASPSGLAVDMGNLPFVSVEGITDNSQNRLSRFEFGTVATIGTSGSTNPPSGWVGPLQPVVRSVGHALPLYGAGFGYDVKNNYVPTNAMITASGISNSEGFLSISSPNHLMESGASIALNGLISSSGTNYNGVYTVTKVNDRNNFSVNIPITTVPSGTLIFSAPVGNPNLTGNNTINETQDTQSWLAGPVDLRWDQTRNVWCGSDFFRNDIVKGYLASDITPALGRGRPTMFTIKTYVPNVIPTYINNIGATTPTTLTPSSYLQVTVDSNNNHPAYFEPGQQINIFNNTNAPQYNGNHNITSVSSDGLILTTNTIFNSGLTANPTSWIMSYSTNNRVDKIYTVYNYDRHLSVKLNSSCDETNLENCAQKEDDIFVVALRISATELIPVYVGY